MTFSFIKGADVSFVDEIESEGGKYYEAGVEKDVLQILKDSGMNAARLRLWNNPEFDYCNPKKTLKMAKRIKDIGLHFLLDFHYSDYWADPSKQYMPKAWQGLSFSELEFAVEEFTADFLFALKAQGTLPDMVQVGNEITNGMIWGEGKVDGEHNSPEQWLKLGKLIAAGIRGVRKVEANPSKLPIMIHIDRGGSYEESEAFYDKLADMKLEFEVIGLSYYSWWHGTLEQFTENTHQLALRYNKPINIVEVAYPWTLTPSDDQPLIFNTEEWIYPGYPATVEGQEKWLGDLMLRIKEIPNGLGHGLYYWEPCWIPSKPTWSVGHENNWSNLTMFDYKGNKLESLNIFQSY